MKLLFLGTAQDGGVPQVGCSCANCSTVRRSAASIALIEDKDALIIDVTPDFRWQYHRLAGRFGVDISAAYLTHAHWGHYGGLMLFGREGWNCDKLPLYLTRRFHDFLASNEPFSELFQSGNLVAHILAEKVETVHGIKPVVVPHRDEYSDTVGLLIDLNGRKFFYLPCVDRLNTDIHNIIRSCDVSIIDGTFYDESELPHRDMSKIPHPRVRDCIREFSDIADRIIFTHLNHTNPLCEPEGEELMRLLDRGFRVANDGDVLE